MAPYSTQQVLPFGRLSPQDFERLCLWLVRREGFARVEYLGEAGSEQGRDVVAWRGGRRHVFQCKRVKQFGLATVGGLDVAVAVGDLDQVGGVLDNVGVARLGFHDPGGAGDDRQAGRVAA